MEYYIAHMCVCVCVSELMLRNKRYKWQSFLVLLIFMTFICLMHKAVGYGGGREGEGVDN